MAKKSTSLHKILFLCCKCNATHILYNNAEWVFSSWRILSNLTTSDQHLKIDTKLKPRFENITEIRKNTQASAEVKICCHFTIWENNLFYWCERKCQEFWRVLRRVRLIWLSKESHYIRLKWTFTHKFAQYRHISFSMTVDIILFWTPNRTQIVILDRK